jgi:hypothetical protein
LPPEFPELKRDLSGLRNNVNQISRAVHTQARDPCKAAEDAMRHADSAYRILLVLQEKIGHGV